jgi:hypothetical protein
VSSGKKWSWGKGAYGRKLPKKQRIGSWADGAGRRPLGIEPPKKPLRFKPGRVAAIIGGAGLSPVAKTARCANCPRGGCSNCPARR